MSINRKLTIFVVILVVVPMAIVFLVSRIVLNQQIRHSEQSYLENAHKIARNAMLDRKQEMSKAAQFVAHNPAFQKALRETDIRRINEWLQGLNKSYQYLDFIVLVNDTKQILAMLPRTMKYFEPWDMNGLIDRAREAKGPIVSEELFLLDDYFAADSAEYNKYKVWLVDREGNKTNEYLHKGQTGIVVVPVFDQEQFGQLLGYLTVGDISNNDDFFPAYYSKSVKNSFLALSIDGIRIASNIKTPKKGNFLGSTIPLAMDSLEGYKYYYFGRVNFGDETHVFLDEPILDINGKVIGVLGVGIPEEKFSMILSTNNKMIFMVTVFCLIIMLILGRYLSNIITRPIIVATDFAQKLSAGERNSTIPESLLASGHSETTILLRTFQQLAQDLQQHEEERQDYLHQLEQEHLRQQRLAEQLREMNDELETKVSARTLDLQQAIQALKKADAIKSQFLANMSHELRTPLSSIICCSEVLKDRLMGELNEKQEKYLLNILNSGTHLLQLINDILDISKIEAGKMKLNLSNFYISQVLAQSYEIVKSLAYRKNIDLTIRCEPEDFLVNADSKKMVQILYNVLSNAIKFTPDFGRVEVKVHKRGEFAQISVKDNGIGIDEQDQDRVFLEFEQIDSSYERQYEGTGLGLPLTRKLVQMHGGEIYLTSKLDVGTEVIFTIPINTEKFLTDGAKF